MEGVAGPDPAECEREGRRRFYVALAGIFGLFLCPFISFWVALRQPKGDPSPWRRRLFALAIIDVVVGMCLLGQPKAVAGSSTRSHARMGVALSASEPGDGVVVERVTDGSPAAKAGVHAGDKITAVDGTPVRSDDSLREEIGETLPGTARVLRVARGASELDIPVVPVAPGPEPLFAPTRGPSQPWSTRSILREAAGYLAALATRSRYTCAARVATPRGDFEAHPRRDRRPGPLGAHAISVCRDQPAASSACRWAGLSSR